MGEQDATQAAAWDLEVVLLHTLSLTATHCDKQPMYPQRLDPSYWVQDTGDTLRALQLGKPCHYFA